MITAAQLVGVVVVVVLPGADPRTGDVIPQGTEARRARSHSREKLHPETMETGAHEHGDPCGSGKSCPEGYRSRGPSESRFKKLGPRRGITSPS